MDAFCFLPALVSKMEGRHERKQSDSACMRHRRTILLVLPTCPCRGVEIRRCQEMYPKWMNSLLACGIPLCAKSLVAGGCLTAGKVGGHIDTCTGHSFE